MDFINSQNVIIGLLIVIIIFLFQLLKQLKNRYWENNERNDLLRENNKLLKELVDEGKAIMDEEE